MKKAISILLLAAMLLPLAACGVARGEVVTVPTDAERVVALSLSADSGAPEPKPLTEMPAPAYNEERYTFSATAAAGKLTINADASVRYPASLQLPLARVSATGFSQEIAKAYFDYFFTGEQPTVVENYGEAQYTKESLRETIALYEQQIADGTIMEQSMLTAGEARAEIERLKAMIPNAPDAYPPIAVSDGTMLPGVWMHNDTPEPLLELNVRTDHESLNIYTPVNKDDHAVAHLSYHRRETRKQSYYEAAETPLAPDASIEGMTVTWDNAVQVCKDFFAVGGVTDMVVSEAFRLEKDGNSAYRFHFVRSVAGVPLAVNHEITRYKDSNTPWDYESVYMIVDKDGLYDVGWSSPTKVTEIVNPAASVMPFSQVKDIFEATVVEFYKTESVRYDGHQWNYAVAVDDIALSLLRIRDVSTEERVGLYVPAWVFYGQRTLEGRPDGNWSPQIVFAINALDGTVIHMEQGY